MSNFVSSETSVAGPIGANSLITPTGTPSTVESGDWDEADLVSSALTNEDDTTEHAQSSNVGEAFDVPHENVVTEIRLANWGVGTSGDDAKLIFRDAADGTKIGETQTVTGERVTQVYSLSRSVDTVRVEVATVDNYVEVYEVDVSVPVMPSHRHG